mmetsp:Transcript_17254/g.60267  ORF Transcript_17254/g.60267 Transcript_17254/m.60267 type:complete len:565 (+) Transcript_17254:101-1795(+)
MPDSGFDDGPKQLQMKRAHLNVNGLDMTVDGGAQYTYKLPFAIQMRKQPCCTRMGPICCPCCSWTGPQDVMDFVDQSSGDQVRYHRLNKKVHVFHNGQHKGYIKGSWQFCRSCRTCVHDVLKMPSPQLSMFDTGGKKFAEVTRPGKGFCLQCYPEFPMRCISGDVYGMPIEIFTCCSCTLESWPFFPKAKTWPDECGFLNGLPTCGYPHNCLFCDPVCCECLAKGPKLKCGLSGFPVLCIGNPCSCIAIFCPCPTCTTKELPITNTFKYETLEVTSDGQVAGTVQFQFRGNSPFQSGYTHDKEKPFFAAMEIAKDGVTGWVSSAILVARSYGLGLPAPILAGLVVPNKSPSFDGEVSTSLSAEVDALMEALDDDNRVIKKCTVGKRNVTGYTLIAVGYDNAWARVGGIMCAGGKRSKRKDCTNKEKFANAVKLAREGGIRPIFLFRFYLEDPEKEIIHRNALKDVDKRFYDFFHTGGYEQRRLACTCIRVYKFPFNFTVEKKHLCSICCGSRVRKRVIPVDAVKPSSAPLQLLMTPGKKMVQPMQAWEQPAQPTTNECEEVAEG